MACEGLSKVVDFSKDPAIKRDYRRDPLFRPPILEPITNKEWKPKRFKPFWKKNHNRPEWEELRQKFTF